MALTLNMDVRWPTGRLVHVHCVAEPVVPPRGGYVAEGPIPLDNEDVASLDALREFLTEATRMAADGGRVEVIGYEPDVVKILKLLAIEGPWPDPINISVAGH